MARLEIVANYFNSQFKLKSVSVPNGPYDETDAVRAKDLCTNFVHVQMPDGNVQDLGLEKDDFSEYLNFLKVGLADEAMRAVVYCPQSGLFRYVERLFQLVPSFEQACDPQLADVAWDAAQVESDTYVVSSRSEPSSV